MHELAAAPLYDDGLMCRGSLEEGMTQEGQDDRDMDDWESRRGSTMELVCCNLLVVSKTSFVS